MSMGMSKSKSKNRSNWYEYVYEYEVCLWACIRMNMGMDSIGKSMCMSMGLSASISFCDATYGCGNNTETKQRRNNGYNNNMCFDPALIYVSCRMQSRSPLAFTYLIRICLVLSPGAA